jgi:hypothetical protein
MHRFVILTQTIDHDASCSPEQMFWWRLLSNRDSQTGCADQLVDTVNQYHWYKSEGKSPGDMPSLEIRDPTLVFHHPVRTLTDLPLEESAEEVSHLG